MLEREKFSPFLPDGCPKQKGELPDSGTLKASREGSATGTFWVGFQIPENERYPLFEFGDGQSMSNE